MSARILLVEDEPGLVLTLTDRLTSEGYTVVSERDGPRGLHRAQTESFDVIILDVMLPGQSGFDVCRDLRRQNIVTPILMLTARGQVVDKVVGLKLGADDYLTKPFAMIELLARVEALLRRTPRTTNRDVPDVCTVGPAEVDFRSAEIRRNGEVFELSALEYQLMRFFVNHAGETLSRDEILNHVWGYDTIPSTRTVDVHVARLRQKLETDPSHPQHILTLHGLGYKLVL